MSSSDKLIPITATSRTEYTGRADPVEIYLIDGKFNQVAQSVGTLEARVAPGVYKLKLRAGGSFREEALVVNEGSDPINVELEPLEFASATPLWGTETSREYHQDHSSRLSAEVHEELGEGSALFVFVRDLDGRGRVSPATELYLTDINGELLVDYGAVAEHSVKTRDESNLWAGYTVALEPGSYRLRADTGPAGVVEQLVHVSGGWQTHVFLTRRTFGDGRAGRRPDLVNGSIHMSELGMSFAPGADGFRDADVALKALADRRTDAVPADALRRLLDYKFKNPMLGLYGAYLLTEQESPPQDLVRIVMRNLGTLLGPDHPDLVALDLRLSRLGLSGRAPDRIETPPMIGLGWDAIVRHSRANPRLVPAESLAGRIADRIWGRGPWLVWHPPDAAREETELMDEADLRVALEEIGKATQAVDPDPSAAAELTPLEAGILDISQTLPAETSESVALSAEAADALGVPPSVVSKAVRSLQGKLSVAC